MKLVKLAGYILTILSFVFIVRSFLSFDVNYSLLAKPHVIVLFVIFAFVYAILVYYSAYIWKYLIELLAGKKLPYREISCVYVKANLAKYIPGNVMHFASRNILGAQMEIGQGVMAAATAFEIICLILTCTILSLVLAGNRFLDLLRQYFATLHPAILGIATALVAVVLVVAMILLYRKREWLVQVKAFLTKRFFRRLPVLFLLYSSSMLIPAAMLVSLLSLSAPVTSASILLIVTAYIVSWVIGFVVPGSPGGIGVREAVLIFMLSGVYQEESILLGVVLQRMISIVGDIFAYICVIFMERRNGARKGKKNEEASNHSDPHL